MLSEEPRTYTYLLETLRVESGHLAYHLRHLGDIVEKDEVGLYVLTKLGWEAYSFMEHERPLDEEKPVSDQALLAIWVALMLIVIMSSSAIIFTSSPIDYTALYLDESLGLIDKSFEVIYEIFEQRYIDRSNWTEMTITLIKLQDRLEKLEASGGVDYPETIELALYIEAFTDVMETPDEMFPEATVVNRPLIRDYHFTLVQLKPRLENVS